jgi:hypothetical protein
VTKFIESNPDANVAGTALRKWVLWDTGLTVGQYASRMRSPGSWGGALEIAIVADLKQAGVHVYERVSGSRDQFKQIATFGEAAAAEGAAQAHVVYGGRVHYDALQLLE